MPAEVEVEEVVAVEEAGVAEEERRVPVEVAVRVRNLRSRAPVQNRPAGQNRRVVAAAVVDVSRNPDRVVAVEINHSSSQHSVRVVVGEAIGHRVLAEVEEALGCRALAAVEAATGRPVRIPGQAVPIRVPMCQIVAQIVRIGPTRVRVVATMTSLVYGLAVEEAEHSGNPDRTGLDRAVVVCVLAETEDDRERFRPIVRERGLGVEEEERNGGRAIIVLVVGAIDREEAAVEPSGDPAATIVPDLGSCPRVLAEVVVERNGVPTAIASRIVPVAAATARVGRISGQTTVPIVLRAPSVRPSGRTFRTTTTISGTSGSRTTTSTLTTSRRTG